jgi:hypothetical protein
VSALLIDEEFGSTGISVADSSSELEGIIQNSLSNGFIKVRGRCDLDDLVLAMHEQVDSPSGVVAVRNNLARKGGHSFLVHLQAAGPRYVGGGQGILLVSAIPTVSNDHSRSMKTVPSPKADLASLTARSKFSLKLA